jgi:hypothetical protein
LWPADDDNPVCPLYALLLAGPDGRWLAELRGVEWWDRRRSPGTVLRMRSLRGRLDFRRARWSAFGVGIVLACTPEGRAVLLAAQPDLIEVRDAASGAMIHRLSLPGPCWIRGVGAGPDGSVVALGNLEGEPSVRVWQPALFRWDGLLRRRPSRRPGLRGLFDRLLGRGPTEPPTTTRLLTLPDRAIAYHSALSPDGQTLAVPADLRPYADVSASMEGVVFWDAVTLEERGRVDFRRPIRRLAFAPDGESLLVLTSDGSLRSWPYRAFIGQAGSPQPPVGFNK